MTHEQAIDTMAAERYWLGEMTEAEQQAFEAHYFECAECAEGVRADLRMTDGVRAAAAEARTASPAPPARIASRWKTSYIPLAAAAVLALVVGYQSLVVIPGLRTQLSPRGLYPVTLRPDSRGQEPVVRTGAASDGFTLAIEINDVQEGTLMEYNIATVGGRQASSGRVEAPRAGTPLLLWLPTSVLGEPDRYELSVHDAATGRLLGSYRFVRSN